MSLLSRDPTQRLFQLSSALVVLAMGLPTVVRTWWGQGGFVQVQGLPTPGQRLGLVAIQALVCLLFLGLTLRLTGRREGARVGPALALQLLLAPMVNWQLVLLLVAELPLLFRPRTAHRLFLASLALSGLFLAAAASPGTRPRLAEGHPWPVGLLFLAAHLLAWQVFAYVVGLLAARARREARRQRLLNAELQVLHRSVAMQARAAERLTLLGELHDGVGHHLTALGLHLQLALRREGDARMQAMETAQCLAARALAGVRGVVAEGRQEAFDLRQALGELAEALVAPRIQVDWDPALPPWRGQRGHDLFRCVQELLSNAIRHGGAQSLHLQAARVEALGVLRVTDDGIGGPLHPGGSGLAGLRTRLAAWGGTLEVQPAARAGWTVELRVPVEKS